MNRYKKGEMVTGCVTGIEKYGIFVSLDEYYQWFDSHFRNFRVFC